MFKKKLEVRPALEMVDRYLSREGIIIWYYDISFEEEEISKKIQNYAKSMPYYAIMRYQVILYCGSQNLIPAPLRPPSLGSQDCLMAAESSARIEQCEERNRTRPLLDVPLLGDDFTFLDSHTIVYCKTCIR